MSWNTHWIEFRAAATVQDRYYTNQSQKSALSYGLTEVSALNNEFWDGFMDTPENVHYNEGIIDAIEEVKKQYLLQKSKKIQEKE
jgi:hypothetical protein